jgi:inner membrane protein
MTGSGHRITGIILSIASFKFGYDITSDFFISGVVAIGTILGGNAPDYLEIRTKVYSGGKVVGTKTLIPHRTLTHWVLMWVVFFYFCLLSFTQDSSIYFYDYFSEWVSYVNTNRDVSKFISGFFLGYAIGGLLHLIVDLPNYQKIPIFTPFDKFAFFFWRSGQMEPFIIGACILFTLYYIDIINFNFPVQ